MCALARRGFCAAAGILLAFAALCAVSIQAEAQSTVLVSNTGRADNGSRDPGSNDYAQPFRTGSNTDGYTLDSIVLDFNSAPSSNRLTITVREHDSGDPSGTVLYTLTNPASFSSGLNEFSAPSDASLDANTTYWVVASYFFSTGGPTWWRTLLSTGIDPGNAAGWRINQRYKQANRGTSSWSAGGGARAFQMQVKGRAKTSVTAMLGSPEFYVQEHADYYADLTYRFDLTLTEAVSTPHHEMRDHAFEVTNGRMVKAKRIGGDSAHWRMTVLPIEAREPVTVRLRGNRPCSARGALCTGGGGRITNSPELTLHYETLTMNTAMLPSVSIENTTARENDAYLAFDVRLSKPAKQTIAVDFETVSGGTATEGADYWRSRHRILFRPGESEKPAAVELIADTVSDDGETVLGEISNARVIAAAGPEFGGVTITDAQATGTINAAATTMTAVPDVDIRILDTTGNEGDGGMDFPVRLSRRLSDYVCYDFETLTTGTAVLGDDYLARPKSTQWMWPRTTEQEQFVWIVDDNVNDNGETVKVKISNARLCNDASRTITIARGEATGTIYNSDPLPQEWIARFGRTVADQVIDAVEGRMTASPAPGVEVSVAGERIGGGAAAADEVDARKAESRLAALSAWFRGEEERESAHGFQSRAVTGREILTGTSFAFTEGSAERGFGALWGRGAVSSFDGREGALTLDGEVESAMLGADWSLGRWMAGLALAHSRGEGGYRSAQGGGEVSSTLTGVYPYGRYDVSDVLSLWGVVGLGRGSLTLTQEGADPIETDMDLTMAALGGRGVLVAAPADGGLELAATSDAVLVRTSSDEVRGSTGNLSAAEADVTRLRLGLEGTWYGLGSIVPSFDIGVRQDKGDAETGFGADIGAGLAWSDPASGIEAAVNVRGLLTHDDGDFKERGFAGSLAWDSDPESDLGPSLTISQTVGGAATGGLESLLRPNSAEALLGADDEGDDLRSRRLEARLGYGWPSFGGRYTTTPALGFGLTEAEREVSHSWRLAETRRTGLVFGLDLEASRRESVRGDVGPAHRVLFGLGWQLEGLRRDGASFGLRLETARGDTANDNVRPETVIGIRLTTTW